MADAIDALLEERGKQYGDATEQYARVAQVWSGIIGHEVTALQAALCMVGLKVVRAEMAPDHKDSYDDAQGYVRLAEGIGGPAPVANSLGLPEDWRDQAHTHYGCGCDGGINCPGLGPGIEVTP